MKLEHARQLNVELAPAAVLELLAEAQLADAIERAVRRRSEASSATTKPPPAEAEGG